MKHLVAHTVVALFNVLLSRESFKTRRIYTSKRSKSVSHIYINLRWPKRVKHKSVYQNTKQFPKTEINFPKHKSVYQNTNQFPKTQISLPKHKTISRNTNQKTGPLLCHYQRAWKGLIPRIFVVQHGDLSYALRTFENVLPQLWV